jgi:HK97 gp10 family phage protein
MAAVKMKWNAEAVKRKAIERAQKGLIAVGFQIERDAKQMCPVDSGRLRASISTNWTGSGMERGRTDAFTSGNEYQKQMESVDASQDGIGNPEKKGNDNFTVVIGTNVAYAWFIEFGTSMMGNTPFLRAAFEKNYKNIKQAIKNLKGAT